MRLTLAVHGTTGLIANIHAANQMVQREVRKEVRRYGTNTKVDARLRARVDTGKMRDAIEDRYSDAGLVADVGWHQEEFMAEGDDFYPVFHEFGTSRLAAQPMIRPAHAKHAPILQRNIGDVLRKAVAEIGR